jgi:hypothetical protein
MSTKYHRVSLGNRPELEADLSDRKVSFSDEKPEYTPSESSNDTLLNECDIEDLRQDERQRRAPVTTSRWIWFAHAFLLTTSVSFWLRGMLYAYPSTAKYVEEFSMYCKSIQVASSKTLSI